jgi:hypothetical protein
MYSHFYHSRKEIFDAAKTYLLDNQNLEGLCVDPILDGQWKRTIGQGSHWDPQVAKNTYFDSRHYFQEWLFTRQRKLFRVREDYRVTQTCFAESFNQLASDILNKIELFSRLQIMHHFLVIIRRLLLIPICSYQSIFISSSNYFITGR